MFDFHAEVDEKGLNLLNEWQRRHEHILLSIYELAGSSTEMPRILNQVFGYGRIEAHQALVDQVQSAGNTRQQKQEVHMPDESDASRRITPLARNEARSDGNKSCLELIGILLEARHHEIRRLLIGWIPPLATFTNRPRNF